MSVTLDLALQLEALDRGRAMPAASHRAVEIHPHALILAPLKMAGEDGVVHAFVHGRRGRTPRFRFCPDPRNRDAHNALLEELGLVIGAHVRHATLTGGYPQVVVSSPAAVELLDVLSESTRFDDRNPQIRALGNCLSWFTERYQYAGQQTLVTATELLSGHFRTGMPARSEQHLLASLEWHLPGSDIHARVQAAERVPMGSSTDPEFDRKLLAPLVHKHNRATGPDRSALSRRIGDALADVAFPIHEAILLALEFFERTGLPPLPSLANIQEVEQDAFDRFQDHLASGGFIPKRDSTRTSVYRFENQEETIRNVQAALTLQDDFRREQARLDGRLTSVRVADVRKDGRLKYLVLESTQPRLLLRRFDTLARVDEPKFTVEVVSVESSGPAARITARVVTGMLSPGMPETGAEFDLADHVPDWEYRKRIFAKIKRRIDCPVTAPSPTAPRPRPVDLLAHAEGLS